MGRIDLERLSKEELIELVLRLQRPDKTSRTSSKPPSTDRKERRERSRPGGAKPGHEGHSRVLAEDPQITVDHHPEVCPCCQAALSTDLPGEVVSQHDRIELPVIKPVGLHDTSYGAAHKAFHAVVDGYGSDRDGWDRAAEGFRCELQVAILAASAKGDGDPAMGRLRLVGGCGCSPPAKSTTVAELTGEMRKTDQVRVEPSLPADLFFQIAESANDVILVTTPDMEPPGPLIVYVNPAFTRLTGYGAAEAIGQSPRMLQRSATDRATLNAIRKALLAGLEVHEKVLNFGKGGERYWLDLRIVPLRDGAGRITHFVAIERDVTMDKRRLDLDVCAHIRRHWADAIIVFVTANPKRLPEDYAGGHGVVSKPFSRNGLMSVVRYITEGVLDPPPTTRQPAELTAAPKLLKAWT